MFGRRARSVCAVLNWGAFERFRDSRVAIRDRSALAGSERAVTDSGKLPWEPLGGALLLSLSEVMSQSERVVMRFVPSVSCVLAGFTLFAGSLNVFAKDWFVLPSGAGSKSGAAWEQAADAAGMQEILDQLQPGDRLLIGSGDYRGVKLLLKASGAAGKPITIMGLDRGSGLPVLSSDWDIAKTEKGATAIGIAAGASHVVVRDLVIRGYQIGIRANLGAGEAAREDWRFENVGMDHIRHGFYLSGFKGLQIVGCDLKRYSKHGFRLEAACEDVRYERCTADCSEGDGQWEERTELFPFGFSLNDGGAPNRNVVYESCVARNNMMPLQKNKYKNGDGFIVEGNSEHVTFRNCRSLRNQDGGYDLKVKDVVLENCVAMRNKRDYRIWTTGRLTNCFAGFGNEGVWTKGGPVVLERCTIAVAGRAISTEDAVEGIELNKCLLVTGTPAKSSVSGARKVKMIDCVDLGTLEEAGLVRPEENGGVDDKGLVSTKRPGYGYQGKRANAAK